MISVVGQSLPELGLIRAKDADLGVRGAIVDASTSPDNLEK